MSLPQHPLSAAFPAMSDDDFSALKDDIENHGQREPVIVHDGMVLDGWHRYRACVELNIKPTQFTFAEGDDPVSFVKSQNLHRRHLTGSQRAAAVVACSAWRPADTGRPRAEPRSALGKTTAQSRGELGSPLGKTNAQLAVEASVSERTIKDAKTAQKAGLGPAVRDGAMTAKEAAQVARGTPAKAAAKPAKQPDTPAPRAEPANDPQEAEYTELDAAHDQIKDLQAELAVANAAPEDRDQAKNLIAQLRAEIKVLEATLKAVKTSRDTFQTENAELKAQINRQRREIDRATGKRTA